MFEAMDIFTSKPSSGRAAGAGRDVEWLSHQPQAHPGENRLAQAQGHAQAQAQAGSDVEVLLKQQKVHN